MKKLLFLSFLFFYIRGFSQPSCANGNPSPTTLSPKGEMAEAVAIARIKLYKDHKNPRTGTNPAKHIDAISYSPCGFLKLLDYVTDMKKGYNGLRIYYGSDTANTPDKGKLMLIFVPTTKTVNRGYRINLDDLTSCYRIKGDTPERLDMNDASNYVRAFQRDQWVDFTANGRLKYSSEFEESKSIWYDISLLEPGTDPVDGSSGLVTFLQDLIIKNQVTSVVANFAGFGVTVPKDFYYQLFPVFQFYQGATLKGNFLGSSSKKRSDRLIKFLTDSLDHKVVSLVQMAIAKFEYTDTGIPCPPPPANETCLNMGALLPQN